MEFAVPSPKFHERPEIAALPAVDASVNWTVSGAVPPVGEPENSAVGGVGPVPLVTVT